jgi:hypothetical protein
LETALKSYLQRQCEVGVSDVSDSSDVIELVRSLNFKWFLSLLKRHDLEKTYIGDVYSPITFANKKMFT